MMRLVIVCVVLLAGCSTQQVIREPIEVRVPVPVPCRVQTPAKPAMPTELLPAAASRPAWLRAALEERELLISYTLRLDAALSGCIGEEKK